MPLKSLEGDNPSVPTYEYKCSECEEVFEYFQKMTDEPMKTCPVCSGRLNRLISGGVGVIFKGSGFYTTDYKNNSHKGVDSKSTKETESSTSSDTKKESKKESSTSTDKKTETAKK